MLTKHAALPRRRPTVLLYSRSLEVDAVLQNFAETRAEALLSPFPLGILALALEKGAGGYRCRARLTAASGAEAISVTGADTPRSALLGCLIRARRRLEELRTGRRRRTRLRGSTSLALVASAPSTPGDGG